MFDVVALAEQVKTPFAVAAGTALAVAFGPLSQMAQMHVEHWTFRNGEKFKMSKT